MGLPAAFRLSRRDLDRAGQGRRVRASSGPVSVQLSVIERVGPLQTQVKVGFAIGKPIGGAVARNRVRRRLRVGVQDLVPQLTSSPQSAGRTTLMIVRVTPDAAAMAAIDLNRHMQRAVHRCLDRLPSAHGESRSTS